MNKIIIAFAGILLFSGVCAQAGKSMKDLEKDIAQAKSTTTAAALIESIAVTTPTTDADVAALGRLMDKYPTQGQKALVKITNPKLAKPIETECAKKITQIKADKNKDWSKLPEAERTVKLNSLMSAHYMIAMLGDLKNKESIPFLKQYLAPEYNGLVSYNASVALGKIGDETVLNEMVRDIGRTKEIDLSAFGDKAFAKIVKEIDQPGITPKRKFALIEQIKASRSPERKKALKELALKHPDEDVRNRSGQAYLNAMLLNPEEGDSDFIYEWMPKSINDLNAGWSLTAARIYFPDKKRQLEKRFIPIVADVLKRAQFYSVRSDAADLFGLSKIKESLGNLEECILNDANSTVRGYCRHAYWQITGTIPKKYHPADIGEFEGMLRDPMTAAFMNKLDANSPDKLYFLERKRVFEEFKREQK
ncbi:MAG: hypothetical protein A2X32_08200 [Elusimicrobia bacterium GWC2_64_44]|nr:MAG: hypothetical protein A2X32_08200 [Elusimicrobia bacterium GWC2_64_44]